MTRSAGQLHPLVTDLLATASARDLAHTASLLSRAEPSKRWIADAAKVVDTKPKRAPGDDDSEDDAEEAEYDVSWPVLPSALNSERGS